MPKMPYGQAAGWTRWGRIVLVTLLLVAVADQAMAAGTGGGMPWDSKLEAIASSITGPTAKAVGMLSIALTGLGVAFSEGGSWVRKGLSVIFGLSIAATASSFGLSFFGFTSGAGF